jgi:hypothetical protein
MPEPARDPRAAGVVPTVDDIRRAYYASDSVSWSAWIVEVQLTPAGPALIVMNDDTGQLTRVPVTTGPGGAVTFGDPAPVLVSYVDAPKPAAAAAVWAAAMPPGRRVLASWPDRSRSRPAAGSPAELAAAAVADGRIPASKAARWRAALAGPGGDRARRMLAAHYPLGHPIPEWSARAAGPDPWAVLYGHVKQPAPAASDAPRVYTPPRSRREAEQLYAQLYPAPGDYDPDAFGAPLPELAIVQTGPKLAPEPSAPPGRLYPQAAAAGGPGGIAVTVEHDPAVSAWHSHIHQHNGTGGPYEHDHEHVHQAGSTTGHAVGPGHAHPEAPEEPAGDLASARRPPRPVTFTVAASAMGLNPPARPAVNRPAAAGGPRAP